MIFGYHAINSVIPVFLCPGVQKSHVNSVMPAFLCPGVQKSHVPGFPGN